MDILATLQVYKELADWYERRGQAAMRDRFLILAAESAFSAGNAHEAEQLRQRLLHGNPHHMLKPFNSFAQALESKNIQIYIRDLQVNYPPETAEDLLRDLQSGDSPAEPAIAEGETMLVPGPGIRPVIEMHDDSTLPLAPVTEPFQVYPLRSETDTAVPIAPPTKPAAPKQSSPRKEAPAPTVNPPPRPRPQPMRTAPPPSVASLPPPEPSVPAGAWLPLVLFGMIVTAGVALAFYTLARPFLPMP